MINPTVLGFGKAILHRGNCLSVMRTMPDNSIDSIVTDPPYELGFMGKSWDSTGIAYNIEMWREALRVLKPGGHLLAFSGSRTYHRMTCAIEDAGFEIRDQIMWVYGSGFPKSMNVGKAMDKMAGAERFGTGEMVRGGCRSAREGGELVGSKSIEDLKWKEITKPSTEDAKQWDGWGTALKPAHEPIVVARKPLIGTVAENVLTHGTGAMNISDCRIELNGDFKSKANGRPSQTGLTDNYDSEKVNQMDTLGRWPANLIHDGSDEVISFFPTTTSGKPCGIKAGNNNNVFGQYAGGIPVTGFGDTGSAARFFYCAKASKQDRGDGCEHLMPKQYSHDGRETPIDNAYQRNSNSNSNHHPTVKPTELLRYLWRLVTPPGGIGLDLFMGSGSGGKAAILEKFNYIGIELDEDKDGNSLGYFPVSVARITHAIGTVEQENRQQILFA